MDIYLYDILYRVEAIYPVPEGQVPVDNRVASLYQYAVRVERSMFETANSRV